MFESSSALNELCFWDKETMILNLNSTNVFVANFAKFKLLKSENFGPLFIFK